MSEKIKRKKILRCLFDQTKLHKNDFRKKNKKIIFSLKFKLRTNILNQNKQQISLQRKKEEEEEKKKSISQTYARTNKISL